MNVNEIHLPLNPTKLIPLKNSHNRSHEALVQGAAACQMPRTAHSIIQRGPVELVEYFILTRNEMIISSFKNEKAVDLGLILSPQSPLPSSSPSSSSSSSSSSYTQNAERDNASRSAVLFNIMSKNIDHLGPYITTWPQAVSLLLAPSNITNSFDIALKLADDLSEVAGVKASRLDWYTERGALVAMHCIIETYMLTDSSESFQETR